mmetsp:Transcript_8404/g.19532  ORF Transcript_8404/g.19532 Transcript_8404/m.19532 type:complete len:112 (-) Transcript_8404:26-361(-)
MVDASTPWAPGKVAHLTTSLHESRAAAARRQNRWEVEAQVRRMSRKWAIKNSDGNRKRRPLESSFNDPPISSALDKCLLRDAEGTLLTDLDGCVAVCDGDGIHLRKLKFSQ